jgi:NodT family efflux transporter outer membrane factor (OMF) lipoprotein
VNWLAPLLLSSALAACAAMPQTPPPRAVPATWHEPSLPAGAVDDRWWLAYGDPALDRLVALVDGADDVALAEARVAEARAGLRGARAALAPLLGAGGSADTSRAGDDPPRTDVVAGSVSFSWSPDVSGAERSRARSAEQSALGAEARLAAARLEARRTVVGLYVAARDARARRDAAERTVASLQDTFDVARARRAGGLVPDLDVAQAQAELAAARARPAALREAEARARLALEALLGLPPGALADVFADPVAAPQAAVAARALAPAEVLARRPDLRAAERELAAAGWDARAARADFWPRLTLSALIGGQDVSPASAFLGPGTAYAAGASVAGTLLSFGRLEGARDAADARLQGAAVAYRRTAARALSEVEAALVAGTAAEARRAALAEALEHAEDQTRLAKARYRAGLSPLLEVLVAQRAAYEAEAALTAARADAALAYADLSAAMGLGGEAPGATQLATTR